MRVNCEINKRGTGGGEHRRCDSVTSEKTLCFFLAATRQPKVEVNQRVTLLPSYLATPHCLPLQRGREQGGVSDCTCSVMKLEKKQPTQCDLHLLLFTNECDTTLFFFFIFNFQWRRIQKKKKNQLLNFIKGH